MNSLSSSSYRRQSVGFLKKLKLVTLSHESVHWYTRENGFERDIDDYDDMDDWWDEDEEFEETTESKEDEE